MFFRKSEHLVCSRCGGEFIYWLRSCTYCKEELERPKRWLLRYNLFRENYRRKLWKKAIVNIILSHAILVVAIYCLYAQGWIFFEPSIELIFVFFTILFLSEAIVVVAIKCSIEEKLDIALPKKSLDQYPYRLTTSEDYTVLNFFEQVPPVSRRL